MFPLLCKNWDGFPDHLGGLENSEIYDHLGFPTNKIRLNFNSSHRRKLEKVPFVNTVKPRLTHLGNKVTLSPSAWQNGHAFLAYISWKNLLLIRSPVNTANFVWTIGDRINGVPLTV